MPTLSDWISHATHLDSFELAAVLVTDLHIEHTADADLACTFQDHDFSRSFYRDQIILSLEIWTRENLIFLQQWLDGRSCRIDRYHVVIIGQPGIRTWWYQYVEVMQLRSFKVHEVLDLPFGSGAIRQSWPRLQSHHWFRERWYADIPRIADLGRELHHHCVYLPGGSANSVESGYHKQWLACHMSSLPGVLVDLRFDLEHSDTLCSWLDHELGWQDQAAVDGFRQLRQALTNQEQSPVLYDQDLFRRTLPLYQHSFATVARESLLSQPWSCIGEKTLRPFMLGQFVIPTGPGAVTYLESLGFWFDHDWFDYSYDQERCAILRMQKLITSVARLCEKSLASCRQHLDVYRQRYQDNSELAHQLTVLYLE